MSDLDYLDIPWFLRQNPEEAKKEMQQSSELSEPKADSTEMLCAIRPDYRLVKELKPHCPSCKERLRGNNSILFPYRCSCGVWKYNCDIGPYEGTFRIESA